MSSQTNSRDTSLRARICSPDVGTLLDQATCLLYWMLISLLAIAVLNDPPVLTLGLALLGGVLFSIELHRAYERRVGSPRPMDSSSAFAESLHWFIIGLLGLNYAWFMFKDKPPVAGLLLLGAFFILRLVRERTLFTWTPHDLPIAILVLLTLLSGLALTADPALSMPKLYGVILSILAYYEVAYGVRLRGNFNRWLIALGLLGIGMAGMGLLGADWFSGKLADLSRVYASIPREIVEIPRSIRGGFHPNGVAGTLIFLVPIYAVQSFLGLQAYRRDGSRRARLSLGLTLLALTSTGLTLLLTQSRGALLGLGIASVVLFFAWQRRWALSLVSLVGLVALAGVLLVWFPNLLGSVETATGAGGLSVLSSFDFRLSVWRIALQALPDFPFTGVGIGTFDTVARLLYPLGSLSSASWTITHAHNELLQVAIDLGIPGFVAYVALLAAFVRTAWRAYTWAPDDRIKRLILGLGTGMLAHQIFGLTDAFMLGTKPGVVMWIIMGLVTGLYLDLAPDHLATQGHEQAQSETGVLS